MTLRQIMVDYIMVIQTRKCHQCHQCDGLWDVPFLTEHTKCHSEASSRDGSWPHYANGLFNETSTYQLNQVQVWPFKSSLSFIQIIVIVLHLCERRTLSIFHLCFDSSWQGSLQMDCLSPRSTEPVIYPHLYDQWKGPSRTRRHLEGVIIRLLFPRCNFLHPHIMVPPPPNKHTPAVVAGK